MNSSFLGFKREGKTISWRREKNNIILSSYKFDEIIFPIMNLKQIN